MLLFGLAVLAPRAAEAQLTGAPVITPSASPVAPNQILNIADFEANALMNFYWSARVLSLSPYSFSLTYDNAPNGSTTGTSAPTLVQIDNSIPTDLNQGSVVSGQMYHFAIRPMDLLVGHTPGADGVDWRPGPGTGVNSPPGPGTRSLVLFVHPDGDTTTVSTQSTFAWIFNFDTKAPAPPEITGVDDVDQRLVVHWTPSVDTDVSRYEVWWLPNASTSTSGDCPSPEAAANLDPTKFPNSKTQVDQSATSFGVENGLTNGVCAAVAIRAVDNAGNTGVFSPVVTGVPAEVLDFWKQYKVAGGQEQGGFCFIATAAYGSYAHPAVRVLRWLRDRGLKSNPAGTALVWLYYHLSPPVARAIQADPRLAEITRAWLWPVAIAGATALLLPVLALAAVLAALLRRRLGRPRVGRGAAVAGLVVVLGGAVVPGRAMASDTADRPIATGLVGFGVELKGGPYRPAMGSSDATGADQVWGTTFSNGSNPLYQIGFDVELFRSFGTAGLGGSFGFVQYLGKGIYAASGTQAPDTTVFNLVPLALTAFYRFDLFADVGFPLVPYLRGGLAYDVWWVTIGTGAISRFVTNRNDPSTDQIGRGGKLGLTGAAGLSFLLNSLEPHSARNLYESTGIRAVYLFGEFSASDVNGFGKSGFDFSSQTWNVGAYFEF
jgi:hypothetical protein